MNADDPFHMLFLLFSLVMICYRAYYVGYAAAAAEPVPRVEEGLLLRRLRYTLGTPFVAGSALYLFNPNWMHWSQWEWLPHSIRWFGVVLLLGSTLLYGWTHRHLGKNFTDTVYVRKASTLIQTGPYSWVRHPMYLSALMTAVGTCLTTANWFLGFFGVLLLIIIMTWRTPIEREKADGTTW